MPALKEPLWIETDYSEDKVQERFGEIQIKNRDLCVFLGRIGRLKIETTHDNNLFIFGTPSEASISVEDSDNKIG